MYLSGRKSYIPPRMAPPTDLLNLAYYNGAGCTNKFCGCVSARNTIRHRKNRFRPGDNRNYSWPASSQGSSASEVWIWRAEPARQIRKYAYCNSASRPHGRSRVRAKPPKMDRSPTQNIAVNIDEERQVSGRGERIRTSGPCLPKTVLYQAELLPDRSAVLARPLGRADRRCQAGAC